MTRPLLLAAALTLAACDSSDSANIDLDALADVLGCDAVTEVSVPFTTTGALSASDCTFIDDDGTFADYYAFEIDEAQTVTITMRSEDVDSFLGLIGETGTAIVGDDDSGGGVTGLDAQIERRLTAGVYVVAANSVDVETGAYTLRIQGE